MSRRMFDFQCASGHTTETLIDSDTRSITCPECSKIATRLIGTPRAVLEPFSGAFPGAADAWERRRESHMKKEQHNVREHGTYK
jgi:hypothetical protein